MRGNHRIGGGIPRVDVDPIQDADNVARAVAQYSFESVTDLFTLLDLSRVCRTDGGDQVGMDNPDFHEIHDAVELKRTRRIELGFVESGAPHNTARKHPLIAKIMDGVHGSGVCEHTAVLVKLAQVCGNQCSLMIMTVDN